MTIYIYIYIFGIHVDGQTQQLQELMVDPMKTMKRGGGQRRLLVRWSASVE